MEGGYIWAADVDISMPEPLIDPHYVYADFGGFGFGATGIAHNFSQTEVELYSTPYWAPLPTAEAVPYE